MFQTAYKEGEREIDFLNLYSHCCYDREKYQESVQILQELVDSVPAEKSDDQSVSGAYPERRDQI